MNILTFDVEDSFSVSNISNQPHLETRVVQNVSKVLELLRNEDIKATFFISGWFAEKYPHLIEEINADLHEIGYRSKNLSGFKTPAEFEIDLKEGIEVLRTLTGKKITLYRAPNLSLNSKMLWIYSILAKNGIHASSSVKSFTRISQSEFQNYPVRIKTTYGVIVEFPLNIIKILGIKVPYSISGFFRMSPEWIINFFLRNENYNLISLKLSDFDPYSLSDRNLFSLHRWHLGINTSSTIPKFSSLNKTLVFNTLGQAEEIYNCQDLKIIDLTPFQKTRKNGMAG